MEVIAKSTVHTKRKLAKGVTMTVVLVSLFTLGGCVGGGMDYLSSAKVDRSVSTGTVPTAPVTTDSISDETTVRNAVTSADLHKLNGQSIPWANASTGSAGVIDAIVESNASGVVCRQFRTSRHSYQGIANFSGRTCLVGQGEWQLLSFQQAG
ncbi:MULTISPECIES: RT0821/Lpp0805 family surface protein [unclassified Rhizobium]|uniref:RT0821/Lpp0805 family surface protein n=1 Tax=unclassified Rhizobium TaxID=2613769 RepID=UPI000EA9C589|nr:MULTISPECIES: RT0821/Lpp0805 family surface protein [unclassified Rhizobium]AYG65416.1 hypothetical protein CCGE531_04985 [Rhizobium sp. CCGE531]AYG71899.1 hypothetical protein CCGE532_04980 [Rhizobium sp. CCGE532]